MKKIWNIVACLAVANVLAIAAVLTWLGMTDRLSRERIQSLKEVLSRTNVQENQDKAAAEIAKTKATKDAALAEKMAEPPVTAAQKIQENKVDSEQALQVGLRREREVETLRQSLAAQMATLEQRERQLKDDRAAFEAQRRKLTEIEGAAQFKTALSTLEDQKAHDAKLVLGALLAARQEDQVVAYLARMEEGKRSKIIAEFVKEDPSVAAELLERLRTRGAIPMPPATVTAANDAKTPQPALSAQR